MLHNLRQPLTDVLRDLTDGSPEQPQHSLAVDPNVDQVHEQSDQRGEWKRGCEQLQQ